MVLSTFPASFIMKICKTPVQEASPARTLAKESLEEMPRLKSSKIRSQHPLGTALGRNGGVNIKTPRKPLSRHACQEPEQ